MAGVTACSKPIDILDIDTSILGSINILDTCIDNASSYTSCCVNKITTLHFLPINMVFMTQVNYSLTSLDLLSSLKNEDVVELLTHT